MTWTFEEPSKSVNFLDLTISIEGNEIVTKTYQKEFNLYQYISPLSNHLPKMIQGILYSLLRNYTKNRTLMKRITSRRQSYTSTATFRGDGTAANEGVPPFGCKTASRATETSS